MGDLTKIDSAQAVEITDGTSQSAVLTTSTPAVNEIGLVVRNVVPVATTDVTNVSSSATNVTLLSANNDRSSATFYNDSTASLFLKLGSTSSATSFTVKIPSYGYYELPCRYVGVIDGIWDSANGSVRITEII